MFFSGCHIENYELYLFIYFTKFVSFTVDIQQFEYFTLLMGNCYEDTPLRYRKLLCPASESKLFCVMNIPSLMEAI